MRAVHFGLNRCSSRDPALKTSKVFGLHQRLVAQHRGRKDRSSGTVVPPSNW